MTERRDVVVILGRGTSSRMGRAKGLLQCPATSGQSFLAAIVEAYVVAGFEGLVITTPDLVSAYTEAVPERTLFTVIGCPPGGETGRTLWHGWQNAPAGATHLWAHPIDMPLVEPTTLARLLQLSVSEPRRVVRPSHDGCPGHPVIVPVESMAKLASPHQWRSLAMREVIAEARQMGHIDDTLLLEVPDKGVVTDFDTPADLTDI